MTGPGRVRCPRSRGCTPICVSRGSTGTRTGPGCARGRAASRAALRDAPQDPVLNQYYLAAYTAREATLQQLMGTLPVNKTIERY